MSEDRTQEPSKRRRLEARERGQVARSPELTGAAGLLAASALLGIWGDDLALALIGAGPRLVVGRPDGLGRPARGRRPAPGGGLGGRGPAARHPRRDGGRVDRWPIRPRWAACSRPALLAPDPSRLWALRLDEEGSGSGFAARVGPGLVVGGQGGRRGRRRRLGDPLGPRRPAPARPARAPCPGEGLGRDDAVDGVRPGPGDPGAGPGRLRPPVPAVRGDDAADPRRAPRGPPRRRRRPRPPVPPPQAGPGPPRRRPRAVRRREPGRDRRLGPDHHPRRRPAPSPPDDPLVRQRRDRPRAPQVGRRRQRRRCSKPPRWPWPWPGSGRPSSRPS